jgi:hypothetical protein
MNGYWFTSDLFELEPGEDEEINPGIYGRRLAVWLRAQLEQRGYTVERIINEDWGRCLICSREPSLLWVGCGNIGENPGQDSSFKAIVWHCFTVAEVPFWKRIFKNPETAAALAKLDADLRSVLDAQPDINLVEEP